MSAVGNLYAGLYAGLAPRGAEEHFSELARSDNVRIERIVSHAQASPPGFWYDQEWAEWVVVLAGSAGLLLEGDSEPLTLKPGDHVNLPAHRRHRIEWTDPQEPTVWLAVHYR